MSTSDIDKAYVSPYDKFLFEFDANHEQSRAQKLESEKYKRIALMRDNKDYIDPNNEIWEAF